MRKLIKPTEKAEDIFLDCISKVRDVNLKARLTSCKDAIQNAADEFELKAAIPSLHTFIVSDNVNGVVTAKEMEKVYTDRMVKKDSPGRYYYDKLISLPQFNRCPLCAQRTVSTLDHHLAKTYYPVLSVVPVNLIPSCGECNKVKLDTKALSSEELTIHPYYDDIDTDVWLVAKVIETKPTALLFSSDPPAKWEPILSSRVKHHFKIFKLADLYASHSGEELSNINFSLKKLYKSGGATAVKAYLIEQRDSCMDNHINSWQTAMYSALALSDWFCDGGFDN